MGKRLVDAVRECIGAGEATRDLGGSLNTHEFTEAIIGKVKSGE